MAPPLADKSLILHPPAEGQGFMKRILCSLLIAILPFGSVLADAPKEKNAKVTLVYQHELPNVPGKSIKGVLVEYGRAVTRLVTRMPNPRSSTRPCSMGRSAVRSTTDR
jgi:hypothetical protein